MREAIFAGLAGVLSVMFGCVLLSFCRIWSAIMRITPSERAAYRARREQRQRILIALQQQAQRGQDATSR